MRTRSSFDKRFNHHLSLVQHLCKLPVHFVLGIYEFLFHRKSYQETFLAVEQVPVSQQHVFRETQENLVSVENSVQPHAVALEKFVDHAVRWFVVFFLSETRIDHLHSSDNVRENPFLVFN